MAAVDGSAESARAGAFAVSVKIACVDAAVVMFHVFRPSPGRLESVVFGGPVGGHVGVV